MNEMKCFCKASAACVKIFDENYNHKPRKEWENGAFA